MAPLVCLLRGVNVGGAGTRLPMADFRAALEGLGCRAVATYIQSGNAACLSDRPAGALAAGVTGALVLPNGNRPAAIVLSLAEVEAALAANPFPQAEALPQSLHLVFLSGGEPDIQGLADEATGRDGVRLSGPVLYLHTPDGFGRSRLAARLERHLGGATATARNLATVRAVAALARGLGC